MVFILLLWFSKAAIGMGTYLFSALPQMRPDELSSIIRHQGYMELQARKSFSTQGYPLFISQCPTPPKISDLLRSKIKAVNFKIVSREAESVLHYAYPLKRYDIVLPLIWCLISFSSSYMTDLVPDLKAVIVCDFINKSHTSGTARYQNSTACYQKNPNYEVVTVRTSEWRDGVRYVVDPEK